MSNLPEVTKAIPFPYSREVDRAAWVAARWEYIGSSTMPSILGANAYTSRKRELTKYVKRVDSKADSPYLHAGRLLEPVVIQLANEQHKRYRIHESGASYVSKEFPFALATPDGFVFDTLYDEWGLNETKFTSRDVETWDGHQVPQWAFIQAQWHCGVLGFPWCLVTGLIQGNPRIRAVRVEFDESLFAKYLTEAANFLEEVKQKRKELGLDINNKPAGPETNGEENVVC